MPIVRKAGGENPWQSQMKAFSNKAASENESKLNIIDISDILRQETFEDTAENTNFTDFVVSNLCRNGTFSSKSIISR